MSDEPTTPKPGETPADDITAGDATTASPVESPAAEPVVVEPVAEPTAEPTAMDAASTGEIAAAGAPATGPVDEPGRPREVVYVEAPVPPRVRGNRVVGVLLALAGAIVFAVLYAVVAAVLLFFQGDAFFGPVWRRLMGSDGFWVPVLIFVLAFILLVVIVNRGGWPAHVFGSLLLAFVVYFASIGLVLVVSNVIQGGHQTFSEVATFTPIIAAAILAREVSIWVGLGIAARGRRVRARNAELRADFDRQVAEKRAQYERPVTAAAD